MALLPTSSRRGGGHAPASLRRAAAALACCLLLSLPLAAPAAAAAPSGGSRGPATARVFRHAVFAALAATRASSVVKALGSGLAMLSARSRIDAIERERPPSPAPERESPAGTPSLPPASAGTNGTTVPPPRSSRSGPIFAHSPGSAGPGAADSTSILLTGIALAPPDAPEAIKGAVNAANTIVGRPYVWGGGHRSWYSAGYDCSGAVSFALYGGGLIPRPLSSGELESWGVPGPGRWLTVYASPSHAYAVIAGLRWDTVGDAQGTGPRWHLAGAPPQGFVARHAPGY